MQSIQLDRIKSPIIVFWCIYLPGKSTVMDERSQLKSDKVIYVVQAVLHGVVINGEDTYRKKVVFHLIFSAKPRSWNGFEASRGRYDFEIITDSIGNQIRKIEKIASSGVNGNH